jgi:hypothetical protein
MVSSPRDQVFSGTNAPRNHEIAIGKKLLVSRGLMSHSHWRKKLKLRERNRKQLLLEDTTIVEDSLISYAKEIVLVSSIGTALLQCGLHAPYGSVSEHGVYSGLGVNEEAIIS